MNERDATWPRAVLFDFDGVIVNSEPLHCAATIAVMRDCGLPIDEATYYRELIGYDDRGGFGRLFELKGVTYDDATRARGCGGEERARA